MFSLYILPKFCNIKSSNRILFQWINISVKSCSSTSSTSSSSDSSDSSDSDSDSEKTKTDTKDNKTMSTNATLKKHDLESFLNNMIQAKKLEKTIDVAIKPKKKKENLNKDEPISFEKKIINAAKNVADKLGGDKTKIESDLLEKVLASRVEALKEQAKIQKIVKSGSLSEHNVQENFQNKPIQEKSVIRTLLDEYKKNAKFKQFSKEKTQENFDDKYSKQKSIIQTLLDEYNKQPKKVDEDNKDSLKKLDHIKKSEEQIHIKKSEENIEKKSTLDQHTKQPMEIVENSVSRQLLNDKMFEKQSPNINTKFHVSKLRYIDLWNGKPSEIFENMNDASPNIPELKTLAALERRELKMLTTCPPANVFQEMILWTEQGKLWKFPIDNEQGLEEEQNVHFSEHVFMETHLKGWCPTSGPIRHFMELVCTGLSKNPYMTVQEKVGHIMWYREYFKSKEDLLQEIGAIQEAFPDKMKEITE